MEPTLPRLLDEASEKWADEPYLLKKTANGYSPWSFSETRDIARSFSIWLLSSGFSPGDRIAILGEGSPEWVAGEFGIMGAGMISVPLSPKLSDAELVFRMEHSGSSAILVSRLQLTRMESLSCKCTTHGGREPRIIPLQSGFSERTSFQDAVEDGRRLLCSENPSSLRRLEIIRERIQPDSVAVISYTSGTMGNPKGVMLTHRNFRTNADDSNSLFDNPLKFRTLLILPADHSFTHTVAIFTALTCGVSLYFVDPGSGGLSMLRNISINIQESRPMFIFTVPALSSHIMRRICSEVREKGRLAFWLFQAGIRAGGLWLGDWHHSPPILDKIKAFFPYLLARLLVFPVVVEKAFGDSIRFCVSGGAMLDPRQQKFFASMGVPMYQGYGLTEAAPVVSSNTPRSHKFGTAGIPAPSVRCRIVDENGKELPVGQIGEIVVSGENVMKGYYRNETATNEVLVGGSLRTGDLGFVDDEGFLTLVGRKRALMIASDGEKYSPEIVEEALLCSTDLFSQVVVSCLYRKLPCALVTLDMQALKSRLGTKESSDAAKACALLVSEFQQLQAVAAESHVPSQWQPKTFQILPSSFSESDGTLNSTFKIVRHVVECVHSDAIEYSYTPEGSTPTNPRNLAILEQLLGRA